ncbi:Sbal_3080 family lipoprotein [Marinobacterium lutimaris]|uniref:Egg lysin (Sperm-lysin) n=1 Tax=Marinobacterium lutimaris TaxID=568106 RepID=A0A1H5TCQ5_9GAMM|nr:Sbal_3080 family lipoprotein [Marinobacterium lutimaris]SEF60632.1 Egg lysin (Sperm-lysin) [Marinobacterium lutimaris]
MQYKALSALTLTLALAGCSIQQNVEQTDIPKAQELCVVENPDVRQGFIKALRGALNDKGIKHKVIRESESDSCQWLARYSAHWAWDLALYMRQAEITIYNGNSVVGKAEYDATWGGANLGKFIDAEEKIRELVEELIEVQASAYFQRAFG